MDISRRDFLKGVTATAAAVGFGALAQGTQPAAEAAAAEGEDLLYTASINPQRSGYEWKTSEKELTALFSPLTIGSLEIGSRMVKSAAGSACYLSGLTDELLQYYVNFAKGGCELIYVETISALEIPAGGEYDAETLAWGQNLVAECAKYGASLGYQLSGFGMGENEMSVDDIHANQQRYIEVAKGMKQLGFKAIDINSAGFNMGAHFVSRFHNTRDDEYGIGSVENRARFVTEIIEGIKAECGDDMVVQVLIDCIEENDNIANNPTIMTLDADVTNPHTLNNTVEDGIALAKCFEAAGADAMHLRLGPLGHHVAQFGADLYFILNGIEGASGFGTQYNFKRHWEGKLVGDTSGCGIGIEVAAMYKKELSIPCGVVTYNDPAIAPDMFEQALEDGKVDFYLMNRPLTVDTEYINKLREGRRDEIAPCTRCLHCHIGSNEANAVSGYCRVNALTQRVMREGGPATYELPAAETVKKVMVIGGGPAGMEAARIAALRGHDVTLYEKNGYLGGNLVFANVIKGEHENLIALRDYLARQLEIAGVNVVMSTEVTKDMIEAEAPDAVILAVGGKRPTLEVAGDGATPVVPFDAFFSTDMGENVIVYGSNAQAFDASLWLTVHNKAVTMVTPNPVADFDMQQSQHAKRMMTTALYALGFNAYPQSSIKSVEGGKATIVMETGLERVMDIDAIVDASDMIPNTELVDGISVSEVYTIGDCSSPYNIGLAIRSGNDAGRAV